MPTTSMTETVDTLPKLIVKNYEKYGGKALAMRKKDFGVWNRYTWQDCYDNIKYLCLGLISLGLERGDKVNIIGENSPEWFWAEWGAQAAGAVVTGIFTDSIPSEIQYIADHSEAKFIFAEDQEQVDKMLQIQNELPNLKRVIYWDPKGLPKYDDPILVYFEKAVELGKQYEVDHPNAFNESLEQGKGDDLALILYTSGTGGLPKGAMLTQKTLLDVGRLWHTTGHQMHRSDEDISFISPAWIAEQNMMTAALKGGAVISYPEEPETVQENIREVGPSRCAYSPRLWEAIVSEVRAKMIDSNVVGKLLYSLLLPVGYKFDDICREGRNPNFFWKALHQIAYWCLFRLILDKYGLLKMRHCYTGGALLSPDTFRFLCAAGVHMEQLYSSTETPLVTRHRPSNAKSDTLGPMLREMEIRISDEQEILVRGPLKFSGYYKDPASTEKALDAQGFFHSGDAGFIDENDGELIFIGRVSDLFEVKGGRISPEYTEGKLKFSPYLRDAMIIGGPDKPFVAALVQIDFELIGRWAESHRIPYTTFTDLSQKPEVYELTQKEVERTNRSLPPYAQIKRYIHLHKQFDADEAELTRTRKLRRSFMMERYGDLMNAIYAGEENYGIKTEVKYRDGRKGITEATIRIRTL